MPELPGPYLAVPPFYVKAFPEYLRAAGYYTTNRAKTDYQFGVPFTIWDDLGAERALAQPRGQEPAVLLGVQPRGDAREPDLPVESRAQGEAARHRSGGDPGPAVLSRHAGRAAKSWPASTTTSPTWTAQVGEILKQLEDDGLAENTIVFYWSDHGDGVPRAKRSLYDSGLRVPLMIRWPKALGSTVAAGFRERRARQLHRSRADGPRAGRRRTFRRISRDACSSARKRRRRRRSSSPRATAWTSNTT